ncbi:F-box protein At5g07610-like [Bidens hawaiensis]|uniref:F-box protein At5g07610-like n=1 Tax=Bidens hawaiensis TaxID=980011 RepID=UPI004049BC55
MTTNLNTPFLHDPPITQKMVNKRIKIKKTRNTLKDCFSEAVSTESGATVGSNDDLLNEILRRLPVTSILRFKFVSKHWQSLLSHRRFTLFYDKVPVSLGLFVCDLFVPFDVENPTPPPFRSLNFYRDRSGIKIVQSCNGLLLCLSSNRGTELTRKYYVFNPTTKQFAVLPSVIGGSSASRTIRFMGLAFHEVDSEHYKVVCIRRVNRYGNIFQIQIYSSDTGKWRISQESFHASYFRSFDYEVNYGVYLNGAVHWIPLGFHLVAYFKINIEQLQTMVLPEMSSWSNGGRRYYFGESGGHLHLVQDAGNKNRLHFNVYEILSDYLGWIIKYRVELDELPNAYPYLPKYEIEVFDVVRNEEKEESTFMVVKILGKIIRYNVVNKSFKQLIDLPNILYYQEISCKNVHCFTQILSSF